MERLLHSLLSSCSLLWISSDIDLRLTNAFKFVHKVFLSTMEMLILTSLRSGFAFSSVELQIIYGFGTIRDHFSTFQIFISSNDGFTTPDLDRSKQPTFNQAFRRTLFLLSSNLPPLHCNSRFSRVNGITHGFLSSDILGYDHRKLWTSIYSKYRQSTA